MRILAVLAFVLFGVWILAQTDAPQTAQTDEFPVDFEALGLTEKQSAMKALARSAGSRGLMLRRPHWGEHWNLNVGRAKLECTRRSFGGVQRPMVTLTTGGQTYGMNGAAIGAAGFLDGRTLIQRNEFGTFKVGISFDLIEAGLLMCR